MSATTATRPDVPMMPMDSAESFDRIWSSLDQGPQRREVRSPDRRRRGDRVRPAGRPRDSSSGVRFPVQGWSALWVRTPSTRLARACRGEARVQSSVTSSVTRSRTTLTDRGIAVILVAGAMIVLAAVTVVTLTALRVTSETYQPLTPAPAVPVTLPLDS